MQEYTSLYRQLRPKQFSEIVGQPHISKILKNAISLNRVSHAYLFCGPRGTGKTTTAKILAKALNCLQRGDNCEPCDNCDSCFRIGKGYSMDVVEIDGASNRGIDEIRDLREKIKLAPAEEKYKVYIIDEVHMLTGEAFNALLKTLEEPPGKTVFILATTEPHKVPETILSRCQRFDFNRIAIKELRNYLEYVVRDQGIKVDSQALELIAKMAHGGLRDALSILEQCSIYSSGELSKDDVETILGKVSDNALNDIFDSVMNGDVVTALEIVNDMVSRGKDIGLIFQDILEYLRGLLVLAAAGSAHHLIPYDSEIIESMKKQLDGAAAEDLFDMVQTVSEFEQQVKWTNQPEIVLELAVIKICRREGKQLKNVEVDEIKSADKKDDSSNLNTIGKPFSSKKENLVEEEDVIKGESETSAAAAEAESTDSKDSEEDISAGLKSDVTLDSVKSCWGEVMKAIKKKRISLHAVLIEGELQELRDQVLTIAFDNKFKFHKETVEQKKNKNLIETVLEKYLNENIQIQAVLKSEEIDSKNDISSGEMGEDPVLKKAKEIFGGKLVKVDDE